MPYQSERLGLDKWRSDELDWSHNDLVDWVDEHGIPRAPIADRPAPAVAGRLFLADDEGPTLYVTSTDETQWLALVEGGHTNDPGAHHARIQVSDSGTAVMTQPTDVDFGTDLSVADDGDGTVTVDSTASGSGTAHASGTLGTMSGGEASQTFQIPEFTGTETTVISGIAVYVDSAPAWAADYAFNYDWRHRWTDEDGDGARGINVRVTVNWDIDPGAGNDLALAYEVRG